MQANPTNPFKLLLRSRKFLLLLLDTLISTIIFVAGQYWPEALGNVEQLIAIYQPVFVALIIAISVEDAAEKRARGEVEAVIAKG